MKTRKKRPKAKARADGIPATKGGVSSSKGGQVASSESGEVVKFEEDGMPQLVKNFYKFRLKEGNRSNVIQNFTIWM